MKVIIHKSESYKYVKFNFMEKNGNAYGKAYYHKDNPYIMILCSLSVSKEARKKGLGTQMQELREELALDLDLKATMLWVKKESWMYYWYIRRGYLYHSDKNEKYCWMIKNI